MARGGFTGGRSGGGGSFGTFGSVGGGDKRKNAKEMFIKKLRGESDDNLSNDEKYKKMFEEKMDKMRAEAMKGARFNVSLPGTSQEGERELSKSALAIIEQLAAKKAKAAAKKAKKAKEIKIRACNFGGLAGGRLDGKGRVFDADGKMVAKINTKTGFIQAKGGMGGSIGKYTGSSASEFKIARFIENGYNAKKLKESKAGVGGFWGGGGSSDDPTGGFWG